ncbi:MAG: B12-binding radical protein, partial [Bacteroidetes bacterium]|nr:B12-binding radical protein [Bacteroidota bacterium]
PLATLYAASYLRSKGYTVKVADIQFADSPSEIIQHFEQFKPDAFVIYEDGFNYLTKMCLTNMREAAFKMIQLANSASVPAIVSGSDASDHAEEYCKSGADFIIIGEAERTLYELLEQIQHNKEFKNVAGLLYPENGQLVRTMPRTVTKDLDALPKPAWDLIDMEPYRKMWLKYHGYFSVNFVTTRGCPYKCNWCAKPIYGNRYNSHSPGYIVNIIKETQAILNYDHIWFADDIFGLKPQWLKEFCALIKKGGIKIKYKIQSRADLLLENESIKYLKESGCDMVWMGAESGSQKVLDAMDKGIQVQEIKDAVTLLKKHKIKTGLFLQFGYLNENAADIRQTINMLHEVSPDDIGISVSYPLPGTKFHDMVKDQLKIKSNWTDSDDLHLMFKNTYTPQFYKHLHRYVHYSFRALQAGGFFKKLSFSNYTRVGLWPYYRFMGMKEKMKLKKIDPVAANLL